MRMTVGVGSYIMFGYNVYDKQQCGCLNVTKQNVSNTIKKKNIRCTACDG